MDELVTCPDQNPACDGSALLHGDWCAREASRASREALALVRLSFREHEAAPLEVVEAYVADALSKAGFAVKRVNIEWLEEPTS